MKLVIEITEEYYKTLHNIPDAISTADMLLIKYGTPLPEHHGRLIDADALTISHGVFVPRLPGDAKVFYGCPMDAVFADEIKNAETIIPATKTKEPTRTMLDCYKCKHHSEDGCYACHFEPATKEGDGE